MARSAHKEMRRRLVLVAAIGLTTPCSCSAGAGMVVEGIRPLHGVDHDVRHGAGGLSVAQLKELGKLVEEVEPNGPCDGEIKAWNDWFHTTSMADYGRSPNQFYKVWWDVARKLANCMNKEFKKGHPNRLKYLQVSQSDHLQEKHLSGNKDDEIRPFSEYGITVVGLEAATEHWDDPTLPEGKVWSSGTKHPYEPGVMNPSNPGDVELKVKYTRAAKRYLVRRDARANLEVIVCKEQFSFVVPTLLSTSKSDSAKKDVYMRTWHCDKGGRILRKAVGGVAVVPGWDNPQGYLVRPKIEDEGKYFKYEKTHMSAEGRVNFTLFVQLANEFFNRTVCEPPVEERKWQESHEGNTSAYFTILAIMPKLEQLQQTRKLIVPMPSSSALHQVSTELEYWDLSTTKPDENERGPLYIASGDGWNKCPNDYVAIKDERECEDSVELMFKELDDKAEFKQNFKLEGRKHPKGCIMMVDGGNKTIYWNNDTRGAGREGFKPVCTRAQGDKADSFVDRPITFVAIRFLCSAPSHPSTIWEKDDKLCTQPYLYTAGAFEALEGTHIDHTSNIPRIRVSKSDWKSGRKSRMNDRLTFEEPCRARNPAELRQSAWIARSVVAMSICMLTFYISRNMN